MNDLVRSPILHHLLVSCANREFTCRFGHFSGSLLLRGDLVSLVSQLVLRDMFNIVRIDDLMLLFHIERLKLR